MFQRYKYTPINETPDNKTIAKNVLYGLCGLITLVFGGYGLYVEINYLSNSANSTQANTTHPNSSAHHSPLFVGSHTLKNTSHLLSPNELLLLATFILVATIMKTITPHDHPQNRAEELNEEEKVSTGRSFSF